MSVTPLPLPQKLRLRENHIFFALIIIIAVLAGLSAVLFTLAIRGTTYLLFGISPSSLRYLLVPNPDEPGHGLSLAQVFSRRPRQRCTANRSRVSLTSRRHSGPSGVREIPDGGSLYRFRAFDGTRGAFGADWRWAGICDRKTVQLGLLRKQPQSIP